MIKTAIFGAGQAGQMIRNWLPADHELICFIDNNFEKQGTFIGEVPVTSLEKAIGMGPDLIWIAVLNRDSAEAIQAQIRASGSGIRTAIEYRDSQDLRLATARMIAAEIEERGIRGAAAELGVFRGEFASEINRLFPERDLYLFDTFEGFDQGDLAKETEFTGGRRVYHPDFTDTSVELVRSALPHPGKARFIKGYFPDSLEQLTGEEEYAFVSLDPDLYEPAKQGLIYFYPRLARGGAIIVHDYNSLQFPGVHAAVSEFCRENDIIPVPLADLHGTAVIVKR